MVCWICLSTIHREEFRFLLRVYNFLLMGAWGDFSGKAFALFVGKSSMPSIRSSTYLESWPHNVSNLWHIATNSVQASQLMLPGSNAIACTTPSNKWITPRQHNDKNVWGTHPSMWELQLSQQGQQRKGWEKKRKKGLFSSLE